MLEEAKLAIPFEYSAHLGQRGVRVGHGAQNQRGDHGVERARVEPERSSNRVCQTHRHRGTVSRLLGLVAHVGLGLDRHHLFHSRRIVAEVDAVAGANLEHAAVKPRQHSVAVNTDFAFHSSAEPIEEPGEDRVVGRSIRERGGTVHNGIVTRWATMEGTTGPQTSLLGRPARYRTGLKDLGGGLWAWLQPNGELGESNAGLVVGRDESLLVDTLWDLRLTRRMLATMATATATAPIRWLVNSHADGDHCWGNQLLPEVHIVATEAAANDMSREDPTRLRMFSRAGAGLTELSARELPPALSRAAQYIPPSISDLVDRFDPTALPGVSGVAGLAAFARLLAAYDFEGIRITPPTQTFTASMQLEIGGRTLELIEVGPAHSPGDLLVHVPDERVVFAGDLVFVGVTPLMWVGPVENWIAGLDRIVALAPRLVVPGHGPTTDLAGVLAVREYWEFVATAVRARLADGQTPHAAAREVARSREFSQRPFAAWDGPERIAVNAAIIARNDTGQRGRVSDTERMRLLARMGELAVELAGR